MYNPLTPPPRTFFPALQNALTVFSPGVTVTSLAIISHPRMPMFEAKSEFCTVPLRICVVVTEFPANSELVTELAAKSFAVRLLSRTSVLVTAPVARSRRRQQSWQPSHWPSCYCRGPARSQPH